MTILRYMKPTAHGGRAGTLLEVLVSLIILTFVCSSVLEVSLHRRNEAMQSKESQISINLALQWQSARLNKDSWAAGDYGDFPNPAGAQWSLQPIDGLYGMQTGGELDSHWRALRILSSPSLNTRGSSYLVRPDTSTTPSPSSE